MQENKTWTDRKFYTVMLLVTGVIFVLSGILPLGLRGLENPGEFRYGEIAREIAVQDKWTSVSQVGGCNIENPAAAYYGAALCVKIFGENAFALRLPSMLAMALTTLLIWLLCIKQQRDRYLAPLAAVIFMSYTIVLRAGAYASVESQLCMMLSWSLGAYFMGCHARKTSVAAAYLASAGAAAGAAFLFCGTLLAAMPAMIIAFYLIWLREWKKLLLSLLLSLPVFAVVVMPLNILLWKTSPQLWRSFYLDGSVRCFAASSAGIPGGFVLLGAVLPAGLLMLGAWKGFSKNFFKEPLERFCMVWFVLLLFFSICSGKGEFCILSCFPALAILTASLTIRCRSEISGKYKVFLEYLANFWISLTIFGGLLAVVVLVIWRLLLVDRLPVFDPASPAALIAVLMVPLYGIILFALRRRSAFIQIFFALGLLVIPAGWCRSGIFSSCSDPEKMPEKFMRESFKDAGITPEDIIVIDSNAASAGAWITGRSDLLVLGNREKINCNVQNSSAECARRFYNAEDILNMLESRGQSRFIYVNTGGKIPPQFKVKNNYSKRGISVVEIDK